MKKNYFFLALAGLALAACSQEDLSLKNANSTKKAADLENIAPTRALQVTVPEGQAVILTATATGDTVAIVTESRQIDVPTSLVPATRATAIAPGDYSNYGLTATYVSAAEIVPFGTSGAYYETIAFEDQDADDYDYNDFIFHVQEKYTTTGVTLDIQPIAYGALNTIDLKATVMITDVKGNVLRSFDSETIKNVRKSLFNDNTKDFINTDTTAIKALGGLKGYKIAKTLKVAYNLASDEYIDVVWTITVNGEKEYVSIPMTQRLANNIKGQNSGSAGKLYNKTVDKDKIPFGLVFCDIYGGKAFKNGNYNCGADWFVYPVERQTIGDVYPNFMEWLAGDEPTFDFSKPVGNYINAIGNPGETSLYEFENIKSNGQILKRANLTKFDQSLFLAK